MADAVVTYCYSSLQHDDSMRLLTLHPGEFETLIEISLKEVRHQDNLAYEAVSYTWATEDDEGKLSSQITCGDSIIAVTKNCELALRYLRKENSIRVLWVDAICINQNNNEERGHQVRLMTQVYSNASRVLIWLGESSPELRVPEPAIRVRLPEVAVGSEHSKPPTQDYTRIQTHDTQERTDTFDPAAAISVSDVFIDYFNRMMVEINQLRRSGDDPKKSPLYVQALSQISQPAYGYPETPLSLGLKHIARCRWWSRVWVVQEAALSKSAILVSSKRTIDYDDFRVWYKILYKDHSSNAGRVFNLFKLAAIKHLDAVDAAGKEVFKPINLLTILDTARRLEASEALDNVCGIYGIAKNLQRMLPTPDYSQSPAELFTDVAKRFLATKSLEILLYTGAPDSISGLPSWVPDWGKPLPWLVPGHPTWHASRSSNAVFEICLDDQILRVKGKEFGKIDRISITEKETYTRDSWDYDLVRNFKISCQACFDLNEYPTGEPISAVVRDALCWRRYHGWHISEDHMESSFKEWLHIVSTVETYDQYDAGVRRHSKNTFDKWIVSNLCLCITANGYIASVPYTSEQGDVVVILAGGGLPFVLRPTGEHYRLIGPCYVHGIMNGEAFPDDSDELEWFSII